MSIIKHIFITTEGGEGHKTAANNLAQKLPEGTMKIVNITEEGWQTLEEWLPAFVFLPLAFLTRNKITKKYNFGAMGARRWNQAQKMGDMATLKKLIRGQPKGNILFASNIAKKTRALLENYPDIETVTITQPVGILTICETINIFNKERNKKIKVKIVLTDLLTQDAEHFLESLRSLDVTKLDVVKIEIDLGPIPYKIGNPCKYDLHVLMRSYCPNLYRDRYLHANIRFNENAGPIHDAFIKIKNEKEQRGYENTVVKYRQKPITLRYEEEAYHQYINKLDWLNSYLALEKADTDNQLKFTLALPEHVDVQSVMLGSQASIQLTKDIIDIQYERYQRHQQATWLFVFCGRETGQHSLFCSAFLAAEAYYKKSKGQFVVVPLTHQHADTISHLYCIASAVLLRSGGLSMMEAASILPRSVYIFAETPRGTAPKTDINDLICNDLMVWERGNALGLEYFLLVACLPHVNIVNKEVYKKAQEKTRNQNLVTLPYLVDPRLEACLTNDLLIFCHKQTMLLSGKAIAQFTIGCAIYVYEKLQRKNISAENINKVINEESNNLVFYANCYVKGCDVFPADKKLVHPSSFIMKYADYMMAALKRESLPIAVDRIVWRNFLNKTYPLAEIYARLFYEDQLHIFDATYVFQYIEVCKQLADSVGVSLDYDSVLKYAFTEQHVAGVPF